MSGRSWAESDIGLKLNALGIDPMGPADQVQRMREHIVELERDLARAEADAESQRDEVRRLYDKFRRSEYSCRDTEADRRRYIDKAHEACMARDGWREQSDKYKAEVACLSRQLEELQAKHGALEQERNATVDRAETAEQQEAIMRRRVDESEMREAELRAKCSAPEETVSYLRLHCADIDGGTFYRAVRDLLMWAEELYESTRPKRKTRAEAVADELLRQREASERGLGVFMVIDEARMLCEAAGVSADEEKPEAP